MIHLNGIAKSYGPQVLFDDLDWHIRPGQRVGLIGPNGAGKSTLVKMIIGDLHPDHGTVRVAKGLRLGHLPQEIARIAGRSVREQARLGLAHVWAVRDELAALEERMGQVSGKALEAAMDEYATLQAHFESLGGFSAENRVESVLGGLGFRTDQIDKDCGTLSGGWQMRVAIARLLLEQPDVLLLDEPTNHLDLESVVWLEGFLQSYPGSLIFISHDRWFLDRLASHIAELGTGGLRVYTGNFEAYVEQAAAEAEILERRQKNQAKQLVHLERFIERFRSKASKARQVQSRVKALEKIERVEGPESRKGIRFKLPEPPKSGRVVMTLSDVDKAYGDKVIYRGLDAELIRGKHIALVGPNGAGKTTLLRILAGTVALDRGVRELGHQARMYYFAQHQVEVLNPRHTVLEEVALAAEDLKPSVLRGVLGAFLFGEDEVTKQIAVLSGGEKNRVALVKMLLTPANVLLLDEPTNHLDMESREVLQEALAEYSGTVILISHDRHFIDGICDEVWEVRDGRITPFPGDFTDYQARVARGERPEPFPLHGGARARPLEIQPSATDAGADARRSNAKDQRRLAAELRQKRTEATKTVKPKVTKAEAEVERLEASLGELRALQADPGHYERGDEVRRVAREVGETEARLAKAYAEWEAAAAELEAIEARFVVADED